MAISTIRETMVLRIVGHKFDKMGLMVYQIGQAQGLIDQQTQRERFTSFPIGRTESLLYSTKTGKPVAQVHNLSNEGG